MDGHEYEYACAQYLKRNGFTKVQVTKASGDQGIDIIATKGKKYGIQCKYYSGAVGNKAVQEAYAGSKFYGCDVAVVMTNNTFTKSAKELAEKLSVELWEKKDEKIIKNQKIYDSHRIRTVYDTLAFLLVFPILFFAVMCVLSSLWSNRLDVELLLITLSIFLLDFWIIYRNTWQNICKRNSDLSIFIGVEETDWNKKKLSVGDLDSILQKIDDKRNLLSDKQYKALRTVEIALCNFRNGIVDDYYNKHPELSISEADYRMPKG